MTTDTQKNRTKKTVLHFAVAAAVLLLLCGVFCGAAAADTVDVSTWDSLVTAVSGWTDTEDMRTIVVTESVSLTSGENYEGIPVRGNVVIMPANTGEGEINIDAQQHGRLFHVMGGGSLTLRGNGSKTLNLTRGKSTGTDGGGGVYVAAGGTLTLADGAKITNCKSIYSVTGTGYAGAVSNSGTFTMTGGEISGCGDSQARGAGAVSNSGTFKMTGGKIANCKSTYYGGAVRNSGTFTMSGGEITSCSAQFGGCIYIDKGCTFIMEEGRISDCSATQGGAVLINTQNAKFNLSGGEITSCSAGDGGAVYLYTENGDGGTFNMYGGKITDCKSTNGNYGDGGGGVYVCANCRFEMSDGEISGCKAGGNKQYGGGVFVRSGQFNMSGGTIESCSAGYNGGGVQVQDGGRFTMSGGEIKNCQSDYGAGVSLWGSTITMTGGKITGCTHYKQDANGGGVYLVDDSIFTFSNGEISGCTSGYGGGVFVNDRCTFTMNGGVITDCHAVNYEGGGVVSTGNGGTFTMNGGEISRCTAATSGGAIHLVSSSTLTTAGSAVIKDCRAKNGGAICGVTGNIFINGGTFSGNIATGLGGVIESVGSSIWIDGGIFENNNAATGGAFYTDAGRLIMTNGIFRENTDSSGANAITTSTGNLVLGGPLTFESSQSFRVINLPPDGFQIGTPTDIYAPSFTDKQFTGLVKNFIIDNENLDGRIFFKIWSPQTASEVLGRIGLQDIDRWIPRADDTTTPPQIIIYLNKPVASSAAVDFSEKDVRPVTADVTISLTYDNDAGKAFVRFYDGNTLVNESNTKTEGLAKGSVVPGFHLSNLNENIEYTVKATLGMKAFPAKTFEYDLGKFGINNPKISVHPANAVYKKGDDPAELSVTAEASNPEYQWERSDNGVTYTEISDATASTYTPSTDTVGSVYYRVKVTGTIGTETRSTYSLAAGIDVYEIYTITYNTGDGTKPPENPATYDGREAIVLKDPVRQYYLGSWKDQSTGSPVSVIYKGTTGDRTFDAVYVPIEYYIMYIDGGIHGNPASYNADTGTITLTPATRTGFKFAGWYDNAEFTGDPVTSISSAAPHDITLYALWTTSLYTVRYHMNGHGTQIADRTAASGMPVPRPPNPVETGYTFINWYSDSTLSVVYDFTLPVESDLDLYAEWRLNTYTVRFNANGGEGSMADQPFTYGEEKPLTANAFTRTGYTFLGWDTAESADTVVYEDGRSVRNLTAYDGGTVTLYAVWYSDQTVITLDDKGGSGGSGTVTAAYGSPLPSVTVPEKTGYRFSGYFANPDGTGTQYYNADGTSHTNWDMAAETATLYAVWDADKTVVTLDNRTGSPVTITAVYDSPMPPVTVPEKAGYRFSGYFANPDGTGTQYYNADGTSHTNWDMAAETATLYAFWTKIPSSGSSSEQTVWLQSSSPGTPGMPDTPDTPDTPGIPDTQTTQNISTLYTENTFIGVSAGDISSLRTVSPETASVTEIRLSSAAAAGISLTNSKGSPVLVPSDTVPSVIPSVVFSEVYDIKPSNPDEKLTEVTVTVPKADVIASGLTTDDVTIYHYLENYEIWVPLDTLRITEDEPNYYYTAKTDGASPFGVLIKRFDDSAAVQPSKEPAAAGTSPAPFLGLFAGLGAAAVLLGMRRR